MAVPSSDDARQALQRLVQSDRVSYTTLLHQPYLPDGFKVAEPTSDGRRWLWTEPPPILVGGYGNPDTYRWAEPTSSVWLAPSQVLSAGARSESDPEQREYLRRSVDLTMRGGTTSGVVYPLAVCEVATKFRVRNVGGASAGAIAAAGTAAAELGRSSDLPPESYTALSAQQRSQGHVRPGFVGMSDTVAWLAQVAPDSLGGVRDEYRLAQLFRPAPAERRVFAVLQALMRRQTWAVPLTVLIAVGRWAKLAIALLVLGGVLATSWLAARLPSWPAVRRPGGGRSWLALPSLGWAGVDLILFFAAVGALLVLVPLLLRTGGSGSPTVPAWVTALAGVSSRYREGRLKQLLSHAFWRPLGAALVLVATAGAAVLHWWQWVAAVLVSATLSAALTVVVAVSIWRYVGSAATRHFGLIAGAAPRTRRRLSELLAGAARPTVQRALLPWLSGCFNELAALPPGQVLRFGHLWQGRQFIPVPAQPAAPADREAWLRETEEIRAVAGDPGRRLVNLELITTDLNRQRPFRFPLPWLDAADPDAEVLYFRREDLAGGGGAAVLPDEVVAAMTDTPPIEVHTNQPGTEKVVLYRLPDPWNLPVIFAVRLSLVLPGLFKAIRLYRLVQGTAIRDDLGRAILDPAGRALGWPPDEEVHAEELWFSDGGITSNFPVHLFDTPLPRWPTFGLNLGTHPVGFPHQDVWLPQDWQATRAPATDFGRSMTGFVGSIVDTARSWRDTMQTGMPGYRGRVAWVRQRPDEGGNNLYMPRDIIASMALRGALAGARLSRRFGDPTQWNRYRWLRLRVALDNLYSLRGETCDSKPFYDDILNGRDDFLDRTGIDYSYDPYGGKIDWYPPEDHRFWQEAAALLANLTAATTSTQNPEPTGLLTMGSPRPQPELRQSPRM